MGPISFSTPSVNTSALSGLSAAQKRLDVAANNIANLGTEGFVRSEVTQQAQPAGGVSTTVNRAPEAGENLIADRVEQLQASNTFQANLRSLQTGNELIGSLIDLRA